jgi:predicted ATPase/class 3 adenylate cyclase
VPGGDLTFLFTDLAGSSRLWEHEQDAMAVALAEHDAIIFAAVEDHDGALFSSMGDGFAAVFATVERAASAAIAAQRDLRGHVWTTSADLQVRMGIHVGPAHRRGADYFGPTLNRCARLMAVGHGGQVLLSGAARELIGPAHQVHDLGHHQLRDLAAPEHVFQLVAAGLELDFPPLRGVSGRGGNLPRQTTRFIGRAADVDRLVTVLAAHRVVTLSGVGGVGKTRLALRGAGVVTPRFTEGQWLCELASVGDPAAVPHLVAAVLGVQPEPGRSPTALLCDRLRSGQTLLVLDNCEHVLDAVAELVEVLVAECDGVTVLATSREPLMVTGEVVQTVRALEAGDALELFVDRACAVRPDFVLTSTNEASVIEICQRLDGVPLAIELAAARTISMNPAEIAARLDERFRLLTGGRRSALERQRTLRGAVEWSHDLLEPSERVVFGRLAVFVGGFTLDAAEVVAAGSDVDGVDIAGTVWSLVRKSMLVADEQEESTRYTMLETLRQFGLEQLVARGEVDAVRREHGRFLASLAEQSRDGERGPDEGVWARRLDVEVGNIRAALTWAIDHDALTIAGRLVAALGFHAYMYMWSEFDSWASTVAAAIDAAPGHVATSAAVLTHVFAADFAWASGDNERARRHIERATEMAAGRGEAGPDATVELETARSNVCLATGDAAGAIEAIERGVVAAGQSDPTMLARTQAHLALALAAANEVESARLAAETAVALATTTRTPTIIGYSNFALGEALLDTDIEAALKALAEADEAVRSVNNRFLVGITRLSFVSALGRSSTPEAAISGYLELLDHWEASANRLQQRVTIRNAAELLSRCGRPDVAAVVHGAMSLRGVEPPAGSPEHVRLTASLARAHASLGDGYEDAVQRGARMTDDQLLEHVRAALSQLLTSGSAPP